MPRLVYHGWFKLILKSLGKSCNSSQENKRELCLFYYENGCYVYSLLNTLNIPLITEDQKDSPNLFPFALWPGTLVNPQWLELPMSGTKFHGPKDVWSIEVRLCHFHAVIYMCLPWLQDLEKWDADRSSSLIKCFLTNFSLETPKRVIGKQCRPRSDAPKCGIWSGSPLFANSLASFY